MERTLVIVSALAFAAVGTAFTACSGDDNGTTSGADSGLGDTSTPVQDSNVPAVDSTVPTQDSNVPTQDSNVPTEDSNAPTDDDASDDAGSDAKSPVDASDDAPGVDASDAQVATDASDASSAGDANDAASETDASDAAASDAGVLLTIINYDNWCTIAINGVVQPAGPTPSAVLRSGSTATLVASPKLLPDGGSKFIIGPDPWFGTNENDGGAASGIDDDSGVNETTTAEVTIGAGPTECVQVCCQFPNNTPVPCPTTNTCLP